MCDKKCVYDYANRCDCSDDDNCGCSHPNNMARNFTCDQIESTQAENGNA